MKPFATRMNAIKTHFFAVLSGRVAALEAQGRNVIRLDEGSPDLPPAPFICDALASAAARPDAHCYQTHHGPKELRQAWASMYLRLYGVEINPEQEIVPLIGSKEGIFHLLQTIVEPGDLVLIPDPGYITYTRGTRFAGGEPYYLPLSPTRGYLPDLDAIPCEVARRAKLLWLNYPNNPTAAVASLAFFTEAVAFARQYDLLVCHDAAYSQVTYDNYKAPSLLQVPGAKEVGLEINTLSKSHNMAGWRVAAALGNIPAGRALFTLKTNADSSYFLPVMEGAIAAMTGDQSWLVSRNRIYQERRDRVIQALRESGLEAEKPLASLYIWLPVPVNFTSESFATRLLEEALVSVTPGTVFGSNGEGFVRISLTAPVERIDQAMERLTDWMRRQ